MLSSLPVCLRFPDGIVEYLPASVRVKAPQGLTVPTEVAAVDPPLAKAGSASTCAGVIWRAGLTQPTGPCAAPLSPSQGLAVCALRHTSHVATPSARPAKPAPRSSRRRAGASRSKGLSATFASHSAVFPACDRSHAWHKRPETLRFFRSDKLDLAEHSPAPGPESKRLAQPHISEWWRTAVCRSTQDTTRPPRLQAPGTIWNTGTASLRVTAPPAAEGELCGSPLVTMPLVVS